MGDGSAWGVRVTYIEQDAPRGLAHAVLISEPFIGRDSFVMYLGDNLLNRGITGFVEEFMKEKPAAQILLTPVPDPQMFGVAELEGDKVRRLVEKPKEPKSNLALVGVYMFGPEIFNSVKRIKPSFRNELEITDAIQDLIDRGLKVSPHLVDGWWKDTGKLEDMLEANRLILDDLTEQLDGELVDCHAALLAPPGRPGRSDPRQRRAARRSAIVTARRRIASPARVTRRDGPPSAGSDRPNLS